jgi:phosphoribosyl-ATP pyrophosphohydrolase
MAGFTLDDLEALIARRAMALDGSSYTAQLLAGGPPVAAKKLGEEAVEAVIVLVQGDRRAIVNESADVLYHLLVALRTRGVPLADVLAELGRRTGQGGLAEKASRAGGAG